MGVVDVAVPVDLPRRGHELHRALGAGDAVALDAAELRLDVVDRGEVALPDPVAMLRRVVVLDELGERPRLRRLDLVRRPSGREPVQVAPRGGQLADLAGERRGQQLDRAAGQALGGRRASAPSPAGIRAVAMSSGRRRRRGRVAAGAPRVDRLSQGDVVGGELGGQLVRPPAPRGRGAAERIAGRTANPRPATSRRRDRAAASRRICYRSAFQRPDALDALAGAERRRAPRPSDVPSGSVRPRSSSSSGTSTNLRSARSAVRDRQALGVVLEVAEQQHVDVDRARAVARAAEHPPLLDLDRLADVEQLLGLERGADPRPRR